MATVEENDRLPGLEMEEKNMHVNDYLQNSYIPLPSSAAQTDN